MFKQFNRDQEFLLPPSLRELIAEGDLVYFIADVTEYLDLTKLIKRYDSLGQNAYHPGMMLSVLFYAYGRGIFSSRKIAESLKENVRFMYLSGMQRPDFRTIADFRKDNLDLIQKYFVDIVRLGMEIGMVPLRNIAIDGTKLQASASRKKMKDRKSIAAQLAEVEAEIARLLEYAETADREENDRDSENDPASPVASKSNDLRTFRDKLQEAKEKLDSNPKQKKANLTDPDCNNQRNTGPGYNGQIAVDCDTQIIVAADVTSEANDLHQLIPMVELAETNTGSEGQSKKIFADSGYNSASALKDLETKPHIDAYAPSRDVVSRGGKPADFFDKENFAYDLENRSCNCPLGLPMRFLRSGINKSGEPYINFIGTECPGCPAKIFCTKADYRNLVVLLADPLMNKMKRKMETADGRNAMRLRRQSVEPVFGILKEHLNFRRFHLRGIIKVKGEFALLCEAFNLKKMHTFIADGRIADILAVVKTKTGGFIDFIGNSLCFIANSGRRVNYTSVN